MSETFFSWLTKKAWELSWTILCVLAGAGAVLLYQVPQSIRDWEKHSWLVGLVAAWAVLQLVVILISNFSRIEGDYFGEEESPPAKKQIRRRKTTAVAGFFLGVVGVAGSGAVALAYAKDPPKTIGEELGAHSASIGSAVAESIKAELSDADETIRSTVQECLAQTRTQAEEQARLQSEVRKLKIDLRHAQERLDKYKREYVVDIDIDGFQFLEGGGRLTHHFKISTWLVNLEGTKVSRGESERSEIFTWEQPQRIGETAEVTGNRIKNLVVPSDRELVIEVSYATNPVPANWRVVTDKTKWTVSRAVLQQTCAKNSPTAVPEKRLSQRVWAHEGAGFDGHVKGRITVRNEL